MPELPTASNKLDSIQIGANTNGGLGGDDDVFAAGGKWEDEEERRFFEDVQDLRDFVPRAVLGVEEDEQDKKEDEEGQEQKRKKEDEEEVKRLEEELKGLEIKEEEGVKAKKTEPAESSAEAAVDDDEDGE
jgi:regulator of nonsense transcripts 2